MQEDYCTIWHYFLFKLCTFHVHACVCTVCVCVSVLIPLVRKRMCSLSSCPSLVPLTVIGAILIAVRWLVDGSTVMLS